MLVVKLETLRKKERCVEEEVKDNLLLYHNVGLITLNLIIHAKKTHTRTHIDFKRDRGRCRGKSGWQVCIMVGEDGQHGKVDDEVEDDAHEEFQCSPYLAFQLVRC